MKEKVFQRGDIISVCLNQDFPQPELRWCLVISPAEFNKLGISLVAPIVQCKDIARVRGFAVVLPDVGLKTHGAVLVNAIRMLDLTARKAKKIEVLPSEIFNDVVARLVAVLE